MNLNLTPILSSEDIGNSLSSINLNFLEIDNFTYSLNLSAFVLFEPLMNFYVNHKDEFKSLITTVQTFSANWDTVKNLVSTNSAKWIKPIVYIHPAPLSFPAYLSSVNLLLSSFNSIYPILNVDLSPPNYVENQKAFIYYYTQSIKDVLNENFTVNSAEVAHCVAEDSRTGCVTCRNHVGRSSTSCRGEQQSCGGCAGSSCQSCATVFCRYPETRTNRTNRYIQATINSSFQDVYERELKGMVYVVKNCSWTFERNL